MCRQDVDSRGQQGRTQGQLPEMPFQCRQALLKPGIDTPEKTFPRFQFEGDAGNGIEGRRLFIPNVSDCESSIVNAQQEDRSNVFIASMPWQGV